MVGAGKVAQQHLACLAGMKDVELVGVCDLSRALAESAAERFGVRGWFTDHRRMIADARPDIVHVTTPAASHFRIAEDCLNADVHVFLEKPATVRFEEFVALRALAESKKRLLVEDYNYLYNLPVRSLLEDVMRGELGDVVHVDVQLCLNVLDKDYPAMDPNVRSPVLDLSGGVIADFLPHLASLLFMFCGSALKVHALWDKRTQLSPLPYDEFCALVRGSRSTGSLLFSAHAQPDLFRMTVFGSRARATADIYENRVTRSSLRSGPKALIPLFNALDEARVTRRSAWRLLWRKLGGGPGAYEGLWLLIGRLYESLAAGTAPPISLEEMYEVNRLVDALRKEGGAK